MFCSVELRKHSQTWNHMFYCFLNNNNRFPNVPKALNEDDFFFSSYDIEKMSNNRNFVHKNGFLFHMLQDNNHSLHI